LKARYHEEKKIIKEILKEKQFEFTLSTTYDDFVEIINSNKRSGLVDQSNIKLTYQGLYDKADAKHKEKQREEQKKIKKLESSFKNIFKKIDINQDTKYEDILNRIETEEAFTKIPTDNDRQRIFLEYKNQLQETCLHHIKRKKEKRKKSKRNKSNEDRANIEPGEAISDIDSTSDVDEKPKIKRHSSRRVRQDDKGDDDDEYEEGETDFDDKTTMDHDGLNEKSPTKHKSSSHKKTKRRKKQKSV
jgi:pre-mRNA-processing factor 40